MSRKSLSILAVILGVLIIVVLFAGLDDLPRDVRSQIQSERKALAAAQTDLGAAQDEVLRNLQTEADLFRAIPASQKWPEQLSASLGALQQASREVEQLTALEKANRRQDRDQATTLLDQESKLRIAAVAQARNIRTQAAHW